MLPRSLTENGKYGKIIGAKDLFCSCFELSSDVIGVGRNLTKSVTMPTKDYNVGSEENDKIRSQPWRSFGTTKFAQVVINAQEMGNSFKK